jgi:hypothetical protein
MELSTHKRTPGARWPVMTLYAAPLADTVLDTQNVAITSARPFPECRLDTL